MVNYGLSSVAYTTVSDRNELILGDPTFHFRPGHDRRHQATVVASVPVAGFTAALRFQYGSGLPYSRAPRLPTSSCCPTARRTSTPDPGTPRVLYERPFNALLPAYHRLDVTLERIVPARGRGDADGSGRAPQRLRPRQPVRVRHLYAAPRGPAAGRAHARAPPRHPMTLRSAFALLVAALALSACDDSIDTPDSLRGTYTLWGALDPTADVQSLRVIPVSDTIGRGNAAPLPITVASVDLATGTETAWRDSVVTFRNGSIGHVYRAALHPAFGSRHRIVVHRESGADVSALVAIPPYVEPVIQAPRTSGGIQFPILWPGAPQLNRVRVVYTLEGGSGQGGELTRDLVGASGPVEFGWQTVLDLSEDDDAIQRAAGGSAGDFAPAVVPDHGRGRERGLAPARRRLRPRRARRAERAQQRPRRLRLRRGVVPGRGPLRPDGVPAGPDEFQEQHCRDALLLRPRPGKRSGERRSGICRTTGPPDRRCRDGACRA